VDLICWTTGPFALEYTFLINTAPQSFFISPGQAIEDYTVARAYCLEVSKEVLSDDNLKDLTRKIGTVRVIYNNGREQTLNLQDLFDSERIEIVPFDSYEHMQFLFHDESIAQIRIGQEGIGLFRGELTAYEEQMTSQNIKKIMELEALGIPHTAVQEAIWRTRIPLENFVVVDGRIRLSIDMQTTEKEEDKVHSAYSSSATVSYRKGGETFLRIDGLLNNLREIHKTELNEAIIELITHYHNDHISEARVKQALVDGSFIRLIGPNPAHQDSIKNAAFIPLDNHRKNTGEAILDITPPNGTPLPLKFSSIGDFQYAAFEVDKDFFVEMFKYNNPNSTNEDGLIYQITHKNVTQLVFGDFNNIGAIENLLDASAANEKLYFEKMESISKIESQLLKAGGFIAMLDKTKSMLEELNNFIPVENHIIRQEMTDEINKLAKEIEDFKKTAVGFEKQLELLDEELDSLPFLKADVIKWMHHAEAFKENDRTDNVIRKLNEVVDPRYIIWQRYHNQRSGEEFKDYIDRFEFNYKCLSADDMDIIIISLELLNLRRAS
jgi:hypothetical protein